MSKRSPLYALGAVLVLGGCFSTRESNSIRYSPSTAQSSLELPEFYETQPSMRVINPSGLDYKIKVIVPKQTDKDSVREQELKIKERKKPNNH